MGIKIESCSCFKKANDIAIEVSMISLKRNRIKIFAKPEKMELQNSISMGTMLSKISNNDNDSLIFEKSDLKSFLKNARSPELIIQSSYHGFSYRKKFNEINGIKYKLIQDKNKKIKSIEKHFISPLTIKLEKLFPNTNFENNWKKYYKENNKEIIDIIMKNNSLTCNTSKNMIQLQVKTECLLSKYKNENCLYKGILSINSLNRNKINKNRVHNIQTFNINSLTGKGSLYLQNGKKYEGNFINGDLNGWCRFINTNGISYEGLFINGNLNGKGEVIKIDENRRKNIFRGDIKNFKKEGKGEEKTNDYTYEGEFSNDLKHGKGKIYYHNNGDGDYYEGEFTKGVITGKGYYVWKNKHTYYGDFVAGKMHGKGIYKWPDGNEYEGDYINNIKEGEGIFKWKDGRIFKGKFKNGKPHGKGILTIKGISFDAIFENGKYLGELQMTISSNTSA